MSYGDVRINSSIKGMFHISESVSVQDIQILIISSFYFEDGGAVP